jgi:predicted MFS family arabinose efflux permease
MCSTISERSEKMQQQRLWTKDFLSIWISNFLLFTTFYGLISSLPVFVMENLHGNKQDIGPIMTVFLIAAVIFRPFAGRWLDTLGRKKLLVIALALFLASSVMYLEVKTLMILLTLRVIHGISFGIGTTAAGTVAIDIIPDKRKGEGIGYYALSMNMAMVVGPFLGLTIASSYGFSTLFIVFTVFALISFLFGMITKTKVVVSKKDERKSFTWTSFVEPKAVPIAFVGMFLSFAYSGLLSYVPVFAKEVGIGSYASYFYVVYALVMVLTRPLTGKFFDRYGEHVIVYPSIILYAIGLFMLSYTSSPVIFLISASVLGLGFGTVFPSFQTIAVLLSDSHRRGLATSTFLLFYDTGIGLGASVLGMIASSKGYHMMYLVSSAVVVLAVFLYYLFHHVRVKRMGESDQYVA